MRVTEKGQVTIPKDIRDRLNIGPGSEVDFVADEKGARLIVVAGGRALLLRLGLAAEAALNDARGKFSRLGKAGRHRFGQLDHLQRPRPVRQAADEAALLQCRDQAMDSGLGGKVQRILHLVEGGRNTRFLQALVDEAQQLQLLAGQHGRLPRAGIPRNSPQGPGGREPDSRDAKQIMNIHYMFDMCSATP